MRNEIISAVAGIAVGAVLGWYVTSTAAESTAAILAQRTVRATLIASENARTTEKNLQRQVDTQRGKINEMEITANEKVLASRAETDRLRACIAAGTCGVRYVRIGTCSAPAAAGPTDPANAGNGTPGELDAVAGQAYFALREGIEREAEKLKLCQGFIRATQ